MVSCAKFEGKLFSDPKCSGPLLQALPLKFQRHVSASLMPSSVEHCAMDTFSFVRDIQDVPVYGKFLVSFDVESLFTNIPLEECIDLAVKYILEGNPDIKLSDTELRDLFSVATAQTHFLFNGSFYNQIDGVAMGSPLAPVLANLFLGRHEKSWLENFDASEILFYRRYVDDTFCLFHSENDALLFFHYINSRHPNIRFTMEKEADHRIPFSDVLIDNNCSHAPITSVYRKKTFTGLLTNYLLFQFHFIFLQTWSRQDTC